jgi:PAS domain S-box-containing protein
VNDDDPIQIDEHLFCSQGEPTSNSRSLVEVFNKIPLSVVAFDSDLRITHLNNFAEKMIGATAEEVIGAKCEDALRCNPCKDTCAIRMAIEKQAETPSFELRFQDTNGSLQVAELNTALLRDQQGNAYGTVAVFRIISTPVALVHDKLGRDSFFGIIGKNRKGQISAFFNCWRASSSTEVS